MSADEWMEKRMRVPLWSQPQSESDTEAAGEEEGKHPSPRPERPGKLKRRAETCASSEGEYTPDHQNRKIRYQGNSEKKISRPPPNTTCHRRLDSCESHLESEMSGAQADEAGTEYGHRKRGGEKGNHSRTKQIRSAVNPFISPLRNSAESIAALNVLERKESNQIASILDPKSTDGSIGDRSVRRSGWIQIWTP
ncbi:hypothetical protein BDV93DRAFT_516421 [Ceratobasidium sp. AG-I]|nr:hypothetical protein BDV93DRAFT_516421 [Ceratobasidium sp. AG-I]